MHLHPDDDDWMDDGDSDDADDAADDEESSYGANGDGESTSARARHGDGGYLQGGAAAAGGQRRCRRRLRRILLHWHRSLAAAVDASFSDQVRRPSPSVGRRPLRRRSAPPRTAGARGACLPICAATCCGGCSSATARRAPVRELVLTGHSLGAGVASLLALLLKRAWRDVPVRIRCFALSPPGGLSRARRRSDARLHAVVRRRSIGCIRAAARRRRAELLRDEAFGGVGRVRHVQGRDLLASRQEGGDADVDAPREQPRQPDPGTRAVSAPLLLKTEVVDSRDGFDVRWAESQLRPAARGMETHTATRPQRSTALYPPGRVL